MVGFFIADLASSIYVLTLGYSALLDEFLIHRLAHSVYRS
jgi:hypothetical protein